MLSVTNKALMLIVVMLNVVMPNVVMLNVVMLSVVHRLISCSAIQPRPQCKQNNQNTKDNQLKFKKQNKKIDS